MENRFKLVARCGSAAVELVHVSGDAIEKQLFSLLWMRGVPVIWWVDANGSLRLWPQPQDGVSVAVAPL